MDPVLNIAALCDLNAWNILCGETPDRYIPVRYILIAYNKVYFKTFLLTQ